MTLSINIRRKKLVGLSQEVQNFSRKNQQSLIVGCRCYGSQVYLEGSSLSWHSTIFTRLDRALCNDHWRSMYPNAIVKVLSKVQFLDHYPLLISCQTNLGNVVPRPFRVKCAWLTHSNYKEVFYSNWDKDISFLYNTRRLTNSLTSERRDVFGSIKLKKKRLLSRIGGIHKR